MTKDETLKNETPTTEVATDKTSATEVVKAAESAARKAVDQFFTRSERRSRRRRLAALAAVSSVIPILTFLLTFLGLDEVSDNVWRRILEEDSISVIQDHAVAAEESSISARDDAAAVRSIRQSAEDVLQRLREYEEQANSVFANLEDNGGLFSYQYRINVPPEGGTSYWRTDISTEEYPMAIVGGWYIYSSEGSESASSCNYQSVVEVFMDRSDPTWSLIVNKVSGCDRLRVDVAYVPAAWVGSVFLPGEASLERTPGQ